MTKPKRQHFCPSSYLARFTEDSTKEGLLKAFRFQDQKVWKAKPTQLAIWSDIYTDGRNSEDPYYLERGLSKIESLAQPLLDRIAARGELPGRESMQFINLMNFLASLTCRTPRSLADFADRTKEQRLRKYFDVMALPQMQSTISKYFNGSSGFRVGTF